jgi:hypothetical protein
MLMPFCKHETTRVHGVGEEAPCERSEYVYFVKEVSARDGKLVAWASRVGGRRAEE